MHRSSVLLLVAAVAACGAEPELGAVHPPPARGAPASPGTVVAVDGDAVAPSAPSAATAPQSLQCVTAASKEGDEDVPHVDRLWVWLHDGAGEATLSRGPLFRMRRDGTWREDRLLGDARAVSLVQAGSSVRLVEPAPTAERGARPAAATTVTVPTAPLSLDVQKDGAFFFGTLDDGTAERAVTCWDQTTLFGSPWAGTPGELTATFDFATGACVDTAGAPARNLLPLAFVRETGFASCADLGDAALNDGDVGAALSGWSLDGATIGDGGLVGAVLEFASLSGAKLATMTLVDAKLSGFVDDATELPTGAVCVAEESPWGGATTSCE